MHILSSNYSDKFLDISALFITHSQQPFFRYFFIFNLLHCVVVNFSEAHNNYRRHH